jgi:hypothetical protein
VYPKRTPRPFAAPSSIWASRCNVREFALSSLVGSDDLYAGRHSAKQCQGSLLNQPILHSPLLQAHAVAEAVVAKVVVECLFVWVEGWQVALTITIWFSAIYITD